MLTHAQIVAEIARGGSVLYKNRLLTTVDDVPSDEQIAIDFPAVSPERGLVTLELATGAVDGNNTDFDFVGVPFDVRRNGVSYAPADFSVAGTTATITPAPPSGVITALTQ